MKRVVNCGLEAATDHTFSYLGKYLLVQVIPVGWWTWALWSWFGLATAALGLGLHVVYLAVLFPGALLINRLAMRVARHRTWDLQPWRGWLAAVLVVALEWGYLLNTNLERETPEVLHNSIGPVFGSVIHLAGVLVIASTAALIAAWSLPGWARVEP